MLSDEEFSAEFPLGDCNGTWCEDGECSSYLALAEVGVLAFQQGGGRWEVKSSFHFRVWKLS